jgi:hypothetical protein
MARNSMLAAFSRETFGRRLKSYISTGEPRLFHNFKVGRPTTCSATP